MASMAAVDMATDMGILQCRSEVAMMKIPRIRNFLIGCALARIASLALGVGVLTPLTAAAAQWDYGVIVDLGVTHTDNIFLENDGLEQSETAYLIAPEFFLTTDSDRLVANLRYRPEAIFYSEFSDSDEAFHALDASLTGALIRDRLFVYLSAINYQSIITPELQIPTGNLPITGNRIDSQIFEARPYWQQRLGQADLLLEAAYIDTQYDSELLQSNVLRSGRMQLDNIERQEGLAWGLGYEYYRLEYEVSAPWEFQRAALNLGFWINGSVRIFADGGVETPYYNILNGDMDSNFWEAGFQYRPNQRLNFEFAMGDRSYGTSYRGTFSYTLRRGEISLTYVEGPMTLASVALNPRPITETDTATNFLDQPGASDRFVNRRADLNISIDLSKSELTLNLFATSRDLRTTADGDALDDQEFLGAALRWSWNIGTKTTFGVGAEINEREQSDRTTRLRRLLVYLTYNFSERLSVSLEANNSKQEDQGTSLFEYEENQLRLFLRTEF